MRREFTKAIKIQVIKRATQHGNIICEKCGGLAKRFQIDHVIADAHGGKAVIDNAMLICEACYTVKNPIDTTIAAKIKRQEAKHLGAKSSSQHKIPSRPKAPKPERQRKDSPFAHLPPPPIARMGKP